MISPSNSRQWRLSEDLPPAHLSSSMNDAKALSYSFSSDPISSSLIDISPRSQKKRKRLVILPVKEFRNFENLETLAMGGCSLSHETLAQCLSSLPKLTNLHLADNPSLSAFICGPQSENSTSLISTFNVEALDSAFSSTNKTTTNISTPKTESSILFY